MTGVIIGMQEKNLKINMDEEIYNENGEELDEEVSTLMENYGLEQDEAEKVQELMNEEGLDEDEAMEIADLL